ncbi:MAG: putative RNA uridine N3 methyltransferase [Nitrososphaerales archaeon]
MDFWIAIPDSALADEQTRRDKSTKIAQIARACAIFKVSKVYIYRDRERDYSSDRRLLKLILQFLDTPQYLRRSLYPKIAELEFAGMLHPLKAPHHKRSKDAKDVKAGEIRQGLAVKVKGNYFVDAGLGSLIPLESSTIEGKRITIKFTSEYPTLRCAVVSKQDINEYWGYEVKDVHSISEMLKGISSLVVMTSKQGEPLNWFETELSQEIRKASSTLIVFGSPNRGLFEILKNERKHPKEFTKYVLNFFPKQAAETVRLEEAIMGCLSLLNYMANKK